MKASIRSGVPIAAAAAALILAGTVSAPAFAAEEGQGHCMGANACKGKSDCKTAKNDCKGMNACKGQGYLTMTKEECDKIEGATFEEAG